MLVSVVIVVDVITDGDMGRVPDSVEGEVAPDGGGAEDDRLREAEAEEVIATVV